MSALLDQTGSCGGRGRAPADAWGALGSSLSAFIYVGNRSKLCSLSASPFPRAGDGH